MNTTHKSGITLTELLVASILIGIVMIGVASFSVSIQQLQTATNRSSLIAMRATAAMNRMAKDAYTAVGDEADRGVETRGTQSVCFRQDDDNDPSSYTGDIWVCYFASPPGPGGTLYLCGWDAWRRSGNRPPNNYNRCNRPNGSAIELVELENRNIAIIVDPPGGGLFTYVEITIPAIFDRTLIYHPIENPRFTVTTRVSPPGHSG